MSKQRNYLKMPNFNGIVAKINEDLNVATEDTTQKTTTDEKTALERKILS